MVIVVCKLCAIQEKAVGFGICMLMGMDALQRLSADLQQENRLCGFNVIISSQCKTKDFIIQMIVVWFAHKLIEGPVIKQRPALLSNGYKTLLQLVAKYIKVQ